MKDFLFNEFNTLTPAAWKQKIQVDLKGDDYNESLIWKSNEGCSCKTILLPQKIDILILYLWLRMDIKFVNLYL